MSTRGLNLLIAEATALAGGNFCASGHHWVEAGGRSCPTGCDACSQTVFRCDRCGVFDYGAEGGPGRQDCQAACGDSMTGWRNGPLDDNPDPWFA